MEHHLLDSLQVIGTAKQLMNKLKIYLQSTDISNNSYVNCSCYIVCFAVDHSLLLLLNL